MLNKEVGYEGRFYDFPDTFNRNGGIRFFELPNGNGIRVEIYSRDQIAGILLNIAQWKEIRWGSTMYLNVKSEEEPTAPESNNDDDNPF